jgi:16S rRNA (adenine1518-N6/adenine1519-N6)-dimethyltransferase
MDGATSTLLPSTRRDWAALIARLGVRPSKGLGQHFLYESGIVDRMVRRAAIGPSDLVLEIGPGLGILTSALLRHAAEVIAIELDHRLSEHLRTAFAAEPRFRLIEGNALTIPTDDVVPPDRAFVVAANLPYAVASAVLRHLLEQLHRPRRMTLMLQKEVAERIAARPPNMSVLGVAVQFYTEPYVAFDVPPTVFIPPPNVESAVVICDLRPALPLPDDQHRLFFRIVNAGFRQKRKQVANSLAAELDLPKAVVSAWLTAVDIDPMRRAQTLDVPEWVRLTQDAPASLSA